MEMEMEMERGGGGDERRQREEDVGATTGFFFAGSASDFYDGARVWQQCSSAYKPTGMVRVFPFTSAQWQELQRQALIYKHIMASVPVPPDLLLPISARAFPEAPPFLFPSTVVSGGSGGGGGAGFNLRFTNNTDPEPGRCRRTDGKKWRCSRDAAPDQKYCERHMHRGRPRSRKPVELRKTNKSTNTTTMTTTTTTAAAAAVVNSLSITSRSVGLLPTVDLKLPLQPMEPNKHLGNIASNQQPWELMGMRNEAYNGVSNFSYPDLNDQCCSFLNPDLSALEENAATDDNVQPPRGFIDASSTDNSAEQMPTLTLSMSNAVYDDEKTDHIQTGLGLGDYSGVKSQQQQSMNWTGGPLAEVLHSSNMTAVSPCAGSTRSSCVNLINLMCKSCCGSHEASPRESPARLLALSPSGVLQKALVSLSDSSSGSSPTFAAAASRPEVAFQWMNQTK